MCLVLVACRQDTEYPLVLVANRDEYFKRPTHYAKYWEDCPAILAGRDLSCNGTWLGVDMTGRFAAVTNYRGAADKKNKIASRGLLVSRYLQGGQTAEEYLTEVISDKDHYGGFNLLVGDQEANYFLSSRERYIRKLTPGIYGVSNGDLDSPWPKVVKGKQLLESRIANHQVDSDSLFALLADNETAGDSQLPDTGVGLEMERKLAPIFVNAGRYGTRASTVLMFNREGVVSFNERNYFPDATEINTLNFKFTIRPRQMP